MTWGKHPRRGLHAFPRAWRDRYGAELHALIDDLDDEGDLRLSDRIDIARKGLAMRRHHMRRRSLYKVLGPLVAAGSVLVGLAWAGTFAPAQTALGPRARGTVIVLHADSATVPPGVRKAILFCTAAPITGQVTTCKALSPRSADQKATVRSVTVGVRSFPQASRTAAADQ
jgi:hypothetical protein